MEKSSVNPNIKKQKSVKTPGSLIGSFFSLLVKVFVMFIFSIFISIIVEWVGMMSDYWDEPGAQHAQVLFEKETKHINDNFESFIFGFRPIEIAHSLVEEFERISFGKIESLDVDGVSSYLLAAYILIKVMLVRFCVLLLSIPAFAIFGGIAIVVGLTERDIRKANGSRESLDSFKLHYDAIPFTLVAPIWIYMIYPFSLNPAYVITPFCFLFYYSLSTAIENYKKHF